MEILKFNQELCKNCYKCVRYCPVKSMRVHNGLPEIVSNECIVCGECVSACPQHAKFATSEIRKIKELIRNGRQVIASVDSTYLAYFETAGFSGVRDALLALGMADAFETAEGAQLVERKLEELVQNADGKPVITSGCPTLVLYAEKHYPEVLPYLAPILSPMQAHAQLLRRRFPEAVVVYISPCIARKEETKDYESVGADYAMTFDELAAWMSEQGVKVLADIKPDPPKIAHGYVVTGGVQEGMNRVDGVDYLAVDTLSDCIKVMQCVVEGGLTNCCIEMSACHGNCIGGTVFARKDRNLLESRRFVETAALHGTEQYDIPERIELYRAMEDHHIHAETEPAEGAVSGILRKMGKYAPEEQIDCGLCGYSTCRESAKAICAGRAEISMCLPYMKEKAETYSEKIINVSPEGIITVSKQLKVKQINNAACRIFGIKDPSDIIGYPVSRIMDEYDFVKLMSIDDTQYTDQIFLADYNVYLERIFICDPQRTIFTCIMRDVTRSRQRKSQLQRTKMHAADLADNIIDKQLRIVHEIASLLGETAAETKVAVHDLKEAILLDEDDEDAER